MEAAFQRNKANLIAAYNRESIALHDSLREELQRREDGFARERKSYIDEIETLRRRLSVVERLETENRSLLEKQQSLSVQIEQSKVDYRRLVEARQYLEDKLRRSLENSRKWKDLHQAWTRGIPGLEYPSSAKHPTDGSPQPAIGSRLATSLPPLPLHPENSPILGFTSTQQERAPPFTYVAPDQRFQISNDCQAGDDGSNAHDTAPIPSHPETLNQGLGVTSRTLESNRGTSGINFDRHVLADGGNSQHEDVGLRPILPINGSDSPIVVSERSLAKNSCRTRKADPVVERVCVRSGSVHEPIQVKSETSSSSPLAMSRSDRATDLHDSLDLDEIEESHYTPRKRRRIAEQRLRSSLHRSMTMDSDDGRLFNDLKTQMFGIHDVKEGHRNIEGDENESISLYLGKDEEMTGRFGLPDDDIIAGVVTSPSKVKPSRKTSMHAVQQMHNTRSRRSLGGTGETGDIGRVNGGAIYPLDLDGCVPSASGSAIHVSPGCPSSVVTHSSNLSQLETPQKGTDNKAPGSNASILRVADPNARILPRTNQSPTPLRQRDRGAAVAPLVAEDGEEVDQILKGQKRISSSSTIPIGKSAQKVKNSRLRLGTLLNEPPIPRAPLDPPRYDHGTADTGRRPCKGAGLPLKNVTSSEQNQCKTYLASSHTSSARPKADESTPIEYAQKIVNPSPPVTWFQNRSSTATRDTNPNSADCLTTRTPKPSNRSEIGRLTTKTNKSCKRKNSEQTYSSKTSATRFQFAETSTPGDTAEVFPDPEPLRARSLHRLHIDDFKVNPNYNSGYDYAFKETVRKRDLRQCLPGCMKPSCCGDNFLKMVKLGGFPILPSSAHLPEKEAENQLLESYLGDDSGKLRHMSNAEKHELLIQAKARQLADHYGKHRQAYERSTSPPGFWDVDFPSTQEVEGYREKAREMEREKKRERYREAMREGGAWLFRDE